MQYMCETAPVNVCACVCFTYLPAYAVTFLNGSHFRPAIYNLNTALVCVSLIINDAEYFLMHLLDICSAHLLIIDLMICFVLFTFLSPVYILLSDIKLEEIF